VPLGPTAANDGQGASRAAQPRHVLVLQNSQEFGKQPITLHHVSIHATNAIRIWPGTTSAIRIWPGTPGSPKFSRIRQSALHNARIHTALIWEQLRSEFRPAQKIRSALDQEISRLARLLVSKSERDLFGATEFQVRDLVLRVGAQAFVEHLRGKKTAIEAVR
jgi:hypothetical protein